MEKYLAAPYHFFLCFYPFQILRNFFYLSEKVSGRATAQGGIDEAVIP